MELHFGFTRLDCFIAPPGKNCAFGNLTVFFDRTAGGDTENDFIASYQAAYLDRDNLDTDAKKGINFSLLTATPGLLSQHWYYEGSATSPPCAEILKFVISKQV